ncbi:bifunctional UDP-N-acetylglucosamine diphosphorylase/glucosamine-1-phosphate N-acetyltransferase GlmU [Oceanicella actignis]|uniref:Bifunctional protein GlmU n=1 Tax=Oceanicella actignis TaxID=1189325 RepID=A0A1M7SDV7_9RHOB|nr:bifunctional UDP-N-acetylglucosamine diphosphorylase/glucosamine-1-phosphate N-acetyltransferase GlmU [Oceanicella actignis]TYO91363.1 UDP-N-acetylglucosamine pyrophosphorylase /glucosamine-1-phosphate N-acetyltransferase [Oceanicella actignis]SET24342.1 UDP-N-acetylglucosamine pyrophosphorylase /glucosamine-1-phosphate N-acetyltransferase [Oceanicella actignis]SHN56655.1 bifunctional UDP-N-acetylglucosamine pyrophosphorylase / Glucosamine-1-phosphate N-acetyltransferase [Oceanicella actignis
MTSRDISAPDPSAPPRPAAVVILAAGEGSRMNSDLPKALHPIGGAPMLAHVIAAAEALEPARMALVVGAGADQVTRAARDLRPDIAVAVQEPRLGTAHAVRQALPALEGFEGDVFVLYADTPLIRPETLRAMAARRAEGAAAVVLGFEAADPGAYGRLIVRDGALERIVEAREAGPDELAVRLCNSGVMCVDAARLPALLAQVRADNAKGEYYLTDIVALLRAQGGAVAVELCPEAETLGVNARDDLARAEAAFQARMRAAALADGVTLVAPETVFFAHDTVLGRDCVVEPNVVFGPGVTAETGARIRAFSHLEDCHVSAGASVGPFARLRGGAEIGPDARVGNFVEIKNAILEEGAKAAHLTYLGDAHVGARANVGAGTITCNYDGFAKHRTEIGEEAFVGSNAALVAPVRVGRGAIVAAGSTITRDVPDDALALARGRQENKPGRAPVLRAALERAARALRGRG